MQAASLRAARVPALTAAKLPRRAARGLAVAPRANTLWQLAPDPKWCAKPENKDLCKRLGQVDLTGTIGSKRLCSVASHDFQSDEAHDLCILEHGGVHLIFEAEGTSSPLDSPSKLFVTDIDSLCAIKVDGKQLEKGVRTQVRPGACLCMGQEAQYEVHRNVFAHA